MNKKLYFLDNYEKKRIIEMHQSATKKQYLSESKQILNEWFWWVLGGTAVLGGAYGLYSKWHSGTGKDQFLEMNSACPNLDLSKAKLLNSESEHKNIADELNKAFEIVDINVFKVFSGKSPEGTTDEKSVKNNLSKIKSIPDYCAVATKYKERYNEDLGERLDSEITTGFKEYVMEPLVGAVEFSAKLEKKFEDDPNAKKENDDNYIYGGGGRDDDGGSDLNYKTCFDEYGLGCKDGQYSHDIKKIQKCLGLPKTGKFNKETESKLRSEFGKSKINADDIPFLCGEF